MPRRIPNSIINLHRKFIVRLISIVISFPRSIILGPSLLVFILSYNVLYDFSIKKFNFYLPTSFNETSLFQETSHISPTYEDSWTQQQDVFNLPYGQNSTDFKYLTKITFSKVSSNTSSSDDFNVLVFDYFNELFQLQKSLLNDHKSLKVISPLSEWPINKLFANYDDQGMASDDYSSIRNNFKFYLIKYINYDLNNLLTFLYVDSIIKSNHLIKYAKHIKLYLLHSNESINDVQYLKSMANKNPTNLLHIDSIISTNKLSSIKDFMQYYLFQKNQDFIANLIITLSNAIISIFLVLFILYVYVSIANEHRIRSSFGLLVGWLVGVLISCGAAVNLIVILHGYKSWRLIFEPSTSFTKIAFMLFITILSSRNLFIIIKTLSNDDTYSLRDIHKRIFHLYTGWNGLPLTVRHTMAGLLNSLILYSVGNLILYYTIEGDFRRYIFRTSTRALEVILVTLVIQCLLQLTYIVGIILIDLKRVDVTKVLNDMQSIHGAAGSGNIKDDPVAEEIDGVNVFSMRLLKLNSPSHLRPDRTSRAYQIGQFFLNMRYSLDNERFGYFLSSFSLLLLLGVYFHWTLIIPANLMDDNKELINLGGLNILSNTNNFIYYLELLSIVVFIITTSLIVFRLTWSSNQAGNSPAISPSVSLRSSDFETEKKFFNSVELAGTKYLPGQVESTKSSQDLVYPGARHSLDVIKIQTNSKSSFIVSIGLDHKVLIWSPMTHPTPAPINISTTVSINGKAKEFWPINHVNISDGGNYIVLINYKYGLVKCFERKKMSYIWESELPANFKDLISSKKFKILESFFRRRTVPGFLARKMLQKKKEGISTGKLSGFASRRGSNVSLTSVNTTVNGNFPPPVSSRAQLDPEDEEIQKELNKDDFIFILESGELLAFSCVDGQLKTSNILLSLYPDTYADLKIVSVKKVTSPRINDRIVCHISNFDIVVATVINNGWKYKKLIVKEGYNQERKTLIPGAMSRSNSYMRDNDFSTAYQLDKQQIKANQEQIRILGPSTQYSELEHLHHTNLPSNTAMHSNKPIIVPVEFVGMVVRVKNFTAELIDIQRGLVLRSFVIGHFKPSTFKVSHSEPTHCRFCGCASIQSFSIVYEDFDQPTLIVHTFTIDMKRSKNNICLRVERDPREIRCLGFSSVTEHQYWYNNVDGWELTDVNMIIGFRKKSIQDDDNYPESEESIELIDKPSKLTFDNLVENSGLLSVRQRRHEQVSQEKRDKDLTIGSSDETATPQSMDLWDGFIITMFDGNEIKYQIPPTNKLRSSQLISGSINCIEKYGYKSVVVSTANLMEIYYLGNDQLIEDDIYFSGSNATIWSVFDDEAKKNPSGTINEEQEVSRQTQPFSSELLFINKRRKMSKRK